MGKATPPSEKPAPRVSARAQADQQARHEREAAALRANLRKRKDQARERLKPEPDIKPE